VSGLKAALLAVAILALGSGAARAERKVALLIGNSAYPGAPRQPGVWDVLPNAAHDVTLVGEALRLDGFDVQTLPPDARYAQIKAAVEQFAQSAGDADMAVIYYAGHGFEYDRHNYLAPVDAPTAVTLADLPRRFIDVDAVVNAVAQAKMSVFFIDACRTSVPFVKVSARAASQRILANSFDDLQRPEGAELAVLYSAARGKPALDAAPPPDDYSPFAWAVAQNIKTPNISIQDVFATITGDVRDKTQQIALQVPYTEGAIYPGHVFRRETGPEAAQPPSPAPVGTPTSNGLSLDPKILAVTDEPVVVARFLRRHSWQDIQSLANAGDPMASYIFGYMNEFGEGVPKNLPLARAWLEKAAAAGTPWGELEYGYFLYRNAETPESKAQGVQVMRAAAMQDYPKAKAFLAQVITSEAASVTYSTNYTANRLAYAASMEKYKYALTLYTQAAEAGYPEAMAAMALRGDPPVRPVWRARLRALADGGDMTGNEWLCDIEAREGDARGALADCKIAAEAGFAIAAARLAVAYHDGLGTAKSDDDARHWTRVALAMSDLPDDLRGVLQGYTFGRGPWGA
jgi:TPR repeat protein